MSKYPPLRGPYDDLTDLLDKFDVNLGDQDQRIAVRAMMLYLSDAKSRREMVTRFQLLGAYIDRVGSLDNAVQAALREEL
jgi:hypothetical protein